MSVLLKLIRRFNAIFFLKINNISIKEMGKGKETRIGKTILKIKSRRNQIP